MVPTAAVPEANGMEIEFPSPRQVIFHPLFDYIRCKYWPKWTESERQQFVENSGYIDFDKDISSLGDFLQHPAACFLVVQLYSIVSVSTSIAIWGIEKVKELPGINGFLEENEARLSTFPQESPVDGRLAWQCFEDGNDSAADDPAHTSDDSVKKQPTATPNAKKPTGKKRPRDSDADAPIKFAKRTSHQLRNRQVHYNVDDEYTPSTNCTLKHCTDRCNESQRDYDDLVKHNEAVEVRLSRAHEILKDLEVKVATYAAQNADLQTLAKKYADLQTSVQKKETEAPKELEPAIDERGEWRGCHGEMDAKVTDLLATLRNYQPVQKQLRDDLYKAKPDLADRMRIHEDGDNVAVAARKRQIAMSEHLKAAKYKPFDIKTPTSPEVAQQNKEKVRRRIKVW